MVSLRTSSSSEDFMTDFGDLKQTQQVQGLHDLLKPHLVTHTRSLHSHRIELMRCTCSCRHELACIDPSLAYNAASTNEGACGEEYRAQGRNHRGGGTYCHAKEVLQGHLRKGTKCAVCVSSPVGARSDLKTSTFLFQNTAFLTKGCSGGNVPNMLNIMMQLRKCCNVRGRALARSALMQLTSFFLL